MVRDYSDITKDADSINARLLRNMSDFNITVDIDHSEYGRADFKIPVTPETLHVLKELNEDLKNVRKRSDNFKSYRLRFRDGEFDLVVTYKHTKEMQTPRQRTAPVNSRVIKLLEEMQSDVETLLDSELTPDDISGF